MSPRQQPTSINPNSLKIRLAYRFLHNLHSLNTKRSNFHNTQIHQRYHRVKIAAYTSMASVVGSRRAWSRSILSKIRSLGVFKRNKKRVIHEEYPNTNKEYADPFGDSGQEVKLRKLVPGVETMDACGLLDETADYIKSLATQVEVMKTLVDFYSTF